MAAIKIIPFRYGDLPVGAVAAMHVSPGIYEQAQMAVSPSRRGRGIGEMLGHAAVDYALAQGAEQD